MKKLAVIILFLSVGIGLYILKNNFQIHSKNEVNDKTTLTWDYSPKKITIEAPVEFTFKLADEKNSPIKDAQIEIEANMNHAGMVPIMTQATSDSNFSYKTKFQPTMRGDWILFLIIKLHNGELIKKEVTFTVH